MQFLSSTQSEQLVYCAAIATAGVCFFTTVLTRDFSNKFGSVLLALLSVSVMLFAIATWGTALVYTLPQPFLLGVFPLSFRCDDLARMFLLLFSVITLAIAIFSPDYLRQNSNIHKGQYWMSFALLAISLLLVLVSADAICFLVFWEVMALSSAALVASDHLQKKVRKAAVIYLGATRSASAILCAGFLWMHSLTNSWSFGNWDFSQPSSHWPALLILIGLCIKAGIWPFHLWLPYAYAAAPSTAAAFMSGFMSKVAMFAIVRIFVLGHLNSPYVIWMAFVLGAITAFWGVLFALVQNQLKKLIAYSSIENMGLILMCISFSLIAKLNNQNLIAHMALIAAIVHCMNHGLFKSLLFISAGAVEKSVGRLDLEHLGGLAKRMPITWVCMLVACLAACALPPLNGFPGKWLLYQALFQDICVKSSIVEKAASLVSLCLLSAVGAMILTAFIKALAVTFLGKARTTNAGSAKECTTAMSVAQVYMAACCILSGLLTNSLVSAVNSALASSSEPAVLVELHLPIPAIATVLIGACLVTYFFFLQPVKARKYITWDCGYGSLTTKAQVTADSFAQPSARIFRPLLRYQNFSKIDGADRRHFPERIHVETRIISILETKVYAPLLAMVNMSSRSIARLQAGSIHIYLLYVCSTLIVLLLLGVAF